MSSSANDENEDQQPLPLETKLFSDSGSTWPFKARRRSSNDSRLLLLGGKLKKKEQKKAHNLFQAWNKIHEFFFNLYVYKKKFR